jgi:hypothetical protein
MMRMYVLFPDPEVGVAVAEVEVGVDVGDEVAEAGQEDGVTAAGTMHEQALEIAVGIEEH